MGISMWEVYFVFIMSDGREVSFEHKVHSGGKIRWYINDSMVMSRL